MERNECIGLRMRNYFDTSFGYSPQVEEQFALNKSERKNEFVAENSISSNKFIYDRKISKYLIVLCTFLRGQVVQLATIKMSAILPLIVRERTGEQANECVWVCGWKSIL